jgi:transposase-like protein
VRMVREATAESGERVGAVTRVARQLGIGPESLRNWVSRPISTRAGVQA